MPAKKFVCSFYGIMPEMKDYLKKGMRNHKIKIFEEPLSLEKLDKKTEILGVFVDSNVTKEVFNKLPHLKFIVTLSTGYDHIDLKEAEKRKITVTNVPTYGENTVAQHTMALILALSRKLFASVKRVKEGIYDYHGLRGFDLKDKTVGVIGTGHIGIHLIEMLKGFNCQILAFDAFPKKELAKKYNFIYVPLKKLLASSDIITLHTPLLPSTHHLINKKNLKLIKKGSYLINTARGGLVEPEAIVMGLQNGQIAGAGLDVLEDEGFIQDPEKLISSNCRQGDIRASLMNNIIIDHPNTIITPHNAFNSLEALKRIFDTAIQNVKSFSLNQIINTVSSKKK